MAPLLTWHLLIVEGHVDGVQDGGVGHERGHEALLPEVAHVRRHVTAVHQNFEVTGTGCRPVNWREILKLHINP